MKFPFDASGNYSNFKLKEQFDITELHCILSIVEHTPSKALILHIASDDPENLFCLSFKTHPFSSNGAAHILEHTVLCGSKKFPVKDPFFTMQKRSLNTFMNAMTGSDFTCYPASSLNKKDFYNLLDVYIDAVFHPLLKPESFYQEGHRLEFAKGSDPSTPLEIKGIVYNEMKGSMASSDSRLWHELLKHLTPDLPYAFNSGGEPKEIASLTYNELKTFFETYYHPSRCLFYFYGNIPLKEHLDVLEKSILGQTHALPPLPPIPKQRAFAKPKEVSMLIPASETESDEGDVVGFGYLTAPIEDQEAVLALTLLDSYLMDTDASVLKKALLDSDLCDTVDSFMDPEMSQVPYVFFCRGVQCSQKEALKKVIHDTLTSLVKSGISKKDLEPSLHQLELARTEIHGEGQPFGLTLFMRSALAMQHGVSPEKALLIHSLFDKLRDHLEDPFYLSSLIEKYLLKNPTCVELLAKATPSLLKDESDAEKAHLTRVKAALSEEQSRELVEKAKVLKHFQEELLNQDVECLPKIHLEDVDKNIKTYLLNQPAMGLYTYGAFTNGMIYADVILSLQDLTEDELILAPLLASLITEVGHKEASYEETLNQMHAHTGGISASCSLLTDAHNPSKVTPVLMVKGKALSRNIEPFLQLLYQIIYHPRFDELKRIEELIQQMYANLQNKLPRHAMRYATQLALSGLTPSGRLSHLFYGLPFFEKIKALKNGGKESIELLSYQLKNLYQKWLQKPYAEMVLVTDSEMLGASVNSASVLFSHLVPFEMPSQEKKIQKHLVHEAHIIPTAVAYNVKAFGVPNYQSPHAPHLLIAASMMENGILHNKIREIGGAYGAGSSYLSTSGSFYFHSYRDPKIASTFKTFHEAADQLTLGHFTDKELEEAKLCIMQHIDAPLSPIGKAIMAYTHMKEGRTPKMRQHFRTALLEASKKGVEESCGLYLTHDTDASYVSFTGLDVYKTEEPLLKNLKLPLAVIAS